jgi:hypothetical protein
MTPEEMTALIENYGTPDYGRSNKQITRRLYNVIVRTKDNKIVETHELVTLRMAREIRKDAHAENMVADIIEDYTIDYADREINPKPIDCSLTPIPSNNRAEQPTLTPHKAEIKKNRDMARAQDNIARSTKNKKYTYNMFRVINKRMGIDIQDTEEKVKEFLTNAIRNPNVTLKDFTIIFVGTVESWGRECE